MHPYLARMASSLSLVVAAWAWYADAYNSRVSPFSLLIAIGMTLGFVGDLFMAELLAVEPHVLAGMASFAAGHIAYIAALIYLGSCAGLCAQDLPWRLAGLDRHRTGGLVSDRVPEQPAGDSPLGGIGLRASAGEHGGLGDRSGLTGAGLAAPGLRGGTLFPERPDSGRRALCQLSLASDRLARVADLWAGADADRVLQR